MLYNIQRLKEFLGSVYFSIFILLLFHISGLIGMNTSSKEWFLMLTPLNLLISVFVLFRHENLKNIKLIFFMLLIFLLGYFLEVLGVNTGLIFGEYMYGPVLGFKWINTPLMIGTNWLILVFCTGVVLDKTNFSIIQKSLIGGLIMTSIDYIIEPVAIKFNFWRWVGGVIPLQNYISWFLFSTLFIYIFYKFNIERNNKVAPWLLVIQIIFFLVLNFVP